VDNGTNVGAIPSIPESSDTAAYTKSIIQWLNDAIQEGDSFLREEYGFNDIDKNISYIMEGEDINVKRKDDTAWFKINRCSKVHSDIISALTDVKPVFAFKTFNDMYQMQASLLNKLVTHWWLTQDIDLRLGDVINWSLVSGVGYALPSWSQHLCNGVGDVDMNTMDPRDIIPIRPVNRGSIQDCLGVIIRQVTSVNYVKWKYPGKAFMVKADRDGSTFRARLRRISTTFRSAVEKLQSQDQTTQDMNVPTVNVYHIYLKDNRINTSMKSIPMGDPDTNWFYEVAPGEKLYPRGRLIVCTGSIILSDGPNPYWHGQFPVCKLVLDPYPWSFIGKSVLKDIIPINDLLSELVSKVAQAARKTLRPGVIADKNAIPDGVLKLLNTEKEGMRLKVNPVMGDGIKLTDPVMVPPYIIELIRMCVDQIDDLSGTKGIGDLMALKQLPSADSIEKIQAAMTPAIRRRGRVIESFLREMAEQVKFNIFQFYSQKRRVQLVGDNGLTFEDFDFDPGNMVPMPNPEDTRPYNERAIEHVNSFPFYIAQNSLLSIAQTSQKMMHLQLRRMGEIDHTTLLEVLEVPNIQQINERLGSELDQKIAAMSQAQVGRPPSAQQAPHMQMKGDGRSVISES
jgi:hypothetical protein